MIIQQAGSRISHFLPALNSQVFSYFLPLISSAAFGSRQTVMHVCPPLPPPCPGSWQIFTRRGISARANSRCGTFASLILRKSFRERKANSKRPLPGSQCRGAATRQGARVFLRRMWVRVNLRTGGDYRRDST